MTAPACPRKIGELQKLREMKYCTQLQNTGKKVDAGSSIDLCLRGVGRNTLFDLAHPKIYCTQCTRKRSALDSESDKKSFFIVPAEATRKDARGLSPANLMLTNT